MRRWTLVALVAGVLLAHLWLAGRMVDMMLDLRPDARQAPPRLSAAFVRELRPQEPAPVRSPQARPPVATSPRHAAAEPVARPASDAASELEMPAEAAALASAPASAVAASELPPLSASQPSPAVEAGAAVAAASAPAAGGEVSPEWPAATRLDYRLQGNYRGEIQGDAQVSWLREGTHYQVHLDVLIGSRFAPLIQRRMSSDGEITAQGLSPRRYDEHTKVMFRSPRVGSVQFEGQELQLANGRREAQPPGVQDASSQFVQLTWLFLTGREPLRVGHRISMPLAMPRRLYHWTYEIIGEEVLDTALGPLQTWHLKPTVQDSRGDLRAEVWVAPALQYLPVRLRISQDENTYIDMLLRQPPLQAAPPGPASAPGRGL